MTTAKSQSFAYILDGKGKGTRVDNDIAEATEDQLVWIHAHYEDKKFKTWLKKESGVNEIICEALMAEETRPRILFRPNGLLIILRGVNLNPKAEPEELVSIRMWIDEKRVISTYETPLLSINDIKQDIDKGIGPQTSGELLVDISEHMASRIEDVIEDINGSVKSIEKAIAKKESQKLRSKIANIRHDIIDLRRYLAPQKDVIARLQTEQISWLSEIDRMQLLEVSDRNIRFIEDLDVAKDDCIVLQEELSNHLSESVSQRMYILSMVAAIFLPLTFLTGLLGVNVGGIPGARHGWGFLTVSLLLIVLAFFEYWIFKRKKWI